jgi:hypothetical protein
MKLHLATYVIRDVTQNFFGKQNSASTVENGLSMRTFVGEETMAAPV